MKLQSNRSGGWYRILASVCLFALPCRVLASEAGQGVFHTTLSDHPVHCSPGSPITTGYTSLFSFDDKNFNVNLPPGSNQLDINFSVLGAFTSSGSLDCFFDEGGTFQATATNDAGDFEWTLIKGEYKDAKPGISEGDPFPFVGSAQCATSRTDDFKTLCDNFDFSFNGLSKALAPNEQGYFHDFAGDFTLRAVPRGRVEPTPKATPVKQPVDGPTGDVPEVEVTFEKGVESAGDLSVTTLADAHGTIPAGVEFPVRGQTEIDHGSGPVPFFEGGDERFIDVDTTATLPAHPVMEVCLPMPVAASPAQVRPVRVLHGEGTSVADRTFVDRTFRTDSTTRKACARVTSFSKFTVVTTDLCGGGQRPSDGLLTIVGGLIGKQTVIVDGLTDCTQYPAKLPQGLRKYCVPDADAVAGQCSVSITLGVNRAGCNQVPPNVTDAHSTSLDTNSYRGKFTRGMNTIDLTPVFGPAIAGLTTLRDATIGPLDFALASAPMRRITTYKLKQQLRGVRPGSAGIVDTDKDVLTIKCIDPSRY